MLRNFSDTNKEGRSAMTYTATAQSAENGPQPKMFGFRLQSWMLILPTIAFLVVFFAYPVASLLGSSFYTPEFSLENYERIADSPVYGRVLMNTLVISLETVLVCLLVGYPLAYLMTTTSQKVRQLLLVAVILPYLTSILVKSYSWLVILGRQGLINELLMSLRFIDEPIKMIYTSSGVVIAMAHIMVPIMVLALYSVMSGVDLRLMRVSDSLGASRVQTFFRVFLPLSLPGVGAGCLLVFIFSLGFYVTPALLGGLRDTMLAMLIATQIQELLNWDFAGALSLVLLVVTLILFFAFNNALGLDRIWGGDKVREPKLNKRDGTKAPSPVVRAGAQLGNFILIQVETFCELVARLLNLVFLPLTAVARRLHGKPGRHRRVSLSLAGVVISIFLLAPIILIIPVSFTNSLYLQFPPSGFSMQWYNEVFSSSYWTDALLRSLYIAPASTALSVALGATCALALARADFRMKNTVFSFVLLPLIVPVIVTAVGMYYFFSQLGLTGTFTGLVIGHSIGSLPVVVILIASALRGLDGNLEKAAMSLGASPVRAFFDVTLPSIRPALLVSSFFAFMHSFDEVVIASFIGGSVNPTLPMRMWVDIQQDIKPTLAAVSTLLILLTLVMMILTNLFQKSRNSQIGE